MMHNSLNLAIGGALAGGDISQSEYDQIKTKLNDENVHKQLRNELAMVVFPIPMNTHPGLKQFADFANINIVVDRVSALHETKLAIMNHNL